MDTVGNVNHVVIMVGHWMFDSKYKKSLPFTIESLNLIYSLSEREVIFFMFETFFLKSYMSTRKEN